MSHLTLKQLRYFEALSQERHFGRAADLCHVSQPALSVQIRVLETGLGAPLFERAPKGVRLTAFGDGFAARVRDILRAVDDLEDLARSAREGLTGHLRLGVIPTVAPYLLPRLMRRLQRSWPGLAIDIRETATAHLLREIADGRLDTAIVALPVSEPGLHEEPLHEEPFVLVRPAADGSRPMPDRAALREMRLLLLEEGHCFRDQALSFCDMDRAHITHGLDATSLSTLVQMVGAGMGVTLVPEMAVPVETRLAQVSTGRFAPPAPSRRLGMIWRRTTPLGGQLARLSATVGDALRETASPPA